MPPVGVREMSMRWKRLWIYPTAIVLVVLLLLFFSLGLHRKPRWIRNFEEKEYARHIPFAEPVAVLDGLAVYRVGVGEPVLLFPYPHGHTTEPMAQSPLAEILVESGRSVVSFDVPGAYRSTREPVGDMAEMIRCADEALDYLGIAAPVDVMGHSMGGLAALAYAIERPQRTGRLVLVTSLSGFPAAARWGFPGSAFRVWEPDFWRIVVWGMRLNGGRGSLALHKRLQNLMGRTTYYDESYFVPVAIDADDFGKGVPIRTIWTRNMYKRLSYADRLGKVTAPSLIIAGLHDPEAPLQCSQQLLEGIADSRLVVFELSGHAPFIEERALFSRTVEAFLNTKQAD
jgi:proline iminopeptidase